MNDLEQLLLSRMRDIKTVHEVSPYPLGAGWWVMFIIIISIIIFYIAVSYKKYLYKRSWKYSLKLELDEMIEKFDSSHPKIIIGKINEILKRVGMHFYNRTEVASLEGLNWLKWLSVRDPNGFNWLKKGKILIMYPYMPEEKFSMSKKEILPLIKAIKDWLD